MMGENELFHDESETDRYLTPIFGSEVSDAAMPSRELADGPVEPRIAYEMIREYLSIEGNATQNAATFCQTYMEPTATKLMAENLQKNAIDKDEYPMTADLENRCVAMIGNLWHADPREEPMGTSTVGSSEACMLGGLAMLFRWKKLAQAAGSTFTRGSVRTSSFPRGTRRAGRSSAATGTLRCARFRLTRSTSPSTWTR